MRFVIDMQGAQSASRYRGIGNYAKSLVAAMAKQRRGHEIIIAVNGALSGTIGEIRRQFGPLVGQDSIIQWQVPIGIAGLDPSHTDRRRGSELIRERFLQSLSADGLLMTTHFEGYVDDTVTSIGRTSANLPTSVIAYDLIPAVYPEVYLADDVYRDFYHEKLEQFRRADQFLCISQSTRNELQSLLSITDDRLHVIHAGVNNAFSAVDRTAALNGPGRSYGNYVLYPGGLDARKNLQRLILAFGELNRSTFANLKLVIVGHVEAADQMKIREWSKSAGLSGERVVLTGYVPETALVSLYACAQLVVFPSYHEGFGLPLLEAMKCDTPVIGADAPGTREILELRTAMFDPHNTKAITDLIAEALSDKAFRTALLANGQHVIQRYSWEKSAELALSALAQLRSAESSKVKVNPTGELRRLAYISPMPPERTGIADYSAELIPSLAKHYAVDVIVGDVKAIDPNGIAQHANIVSVKDFAANAHTYQRVLYHIGNSPYHSHMFGLLQRFPGVVVLHDQFLGSFLRFAETSMNWPHAFWKALYQSHGWSALIDRAVYSDTHAIDNWPAAREVIDRSLGIVTHSNAARDIAERIYSHSYGKRWQTVHFPRLPFSKTVEDLKEQRHAKFRVSTFGFIDQPKCPIELIEAWAITPMSRRDDCELVFVGENEGGEFGREIVQHISALGLEQSVKITGFVNKDHYRLALNHTNVAVQLRKVTRGETSAAVFDCLSAGIALIVNDVGAMSELPPDVVYRIPRVVTTTSIAEALTSLWQDNERAKELGERAAQFVRSAHAPREVARELHGAIEAFYAGDGMMSADVIRDLCPPSSALRADLPGELRSFAVAVAQNRRTPSRQRTLFVDISAIAKTEKLTGMERTSRSILDQLIRSPPAGWRVEPVVAGVDHEHRIASAYLCARYGIPQQAIEATDMLPEAGDILLALDWQPELSKLHRAARARFKERGVRIVFFVFDLLPLLHPEWFPDFVHDAHVEWMNCIAAGDSAICITHTVANDLRAELGRPKYDIDTPIDIGWLHLGSDLHFPCSQAEHAPLTEGQAFVLMVGTVEPRKGYRFVIDAFERAWADGEQTRLVIVGGPGWMVDALIERLTVLAATEPRFTWHRQASDILLTQLYGTCVGLIMASEGEGFGLPLIEAARFGRPLLVRDIPVFREVCGEFATYFNDDTPRSLSITIRDWIAASRSPNARKTDRMPVLDWSQTTDILRGMLLDRQHPQWMVTHSGMDEPDTLEAESVRCQTTDQHAGDRV